MRQIIHFDIDAFFASVEVLLDPKLKGKPVIVGGIGKRGVVSTASYEARKYGVHSAMSTQTARRLCPHGIFLSGSYEKYKAFSRQVFEIIAQVGAPYEQVSIDEAYLDVTHLEATPLEIAHFIQVEVHRQTGLTISVGISYNKFLAKLASDWKKPNGLFEISPKEAHAFLAKLPILKIHGLGKKSAEKLNAVGIYDVSQLQQMPQAYLAYFLGSAWAEEIYQRIRGIDDRPVITHHERKSYGKETTFPEDVTDPILLRRVVDQYAQRLLEQLRQKGIRASTVTLKIKYADFHQVTRSHTLEHSFDQYALIEATLDHLMAQIEDHRPVRLIGISFSGIDENSPIQLSLFE